MNRFVTINLIVGVLLIFILWISFKGSKQPPPTLPNFTLETPEGQPFELTELPSQATVLLVWREDCTVCLSAMNLLSQAACAANPRYKNMNYVFVHSGPPSKPVPQLQNCAENARVLTDETGQLNQVDYFHGLPTTLFFNRHGELLRERGGEYTRHGFGALKSDLDAVTQ